VSPAEQPPSVDLVPLPHTGEIIDLNSTEQVAKAYREIRDLEGRVREVKTLLADALVARSSIEGKRTLHVEGVGKVEVKGATETVWDATALRRDLLEAGMPEERVAEIVVSTVEYKVSAAEARKAASANETYAAIIERHKRTFPKRASVSIS
jgi:hypothetical protein